jgi:hypothetical protein
LTTRNNYILGKERVEIMTENVFSIVPSSTAGHWIIFGIILLFFAFAIYFVFVAYSLRNVKCELTDQGLRLSGGIYRKFIPKNSIIKNGVKLININIEKEFRPVRRSRGMSLPGYREGWYRLSNQEKALLYLSDWSKVVYVPTKNGHSILISPKNAEELLKRILEL